MNEEDYINLQTLLAKFRVVAMKEYGNLDASTKVREKNLKIIRSIDYLRNNTTLNLYDGGIDMEVKMTMEEYKELEKSKENYESLKKEIRGCAKIYQEAGKDENSYIDLVAEINLKKLNKVLLRDVDFAEDTDIDRIEFVK